MRIRRAKLSEDKLGKTIDVVEVVALLEATVGGDRGQDMVAHGRVALARQSGCPEGCPPPIIYPARLDSRTDLHTTPRTTLGPRRAPRRHIYHVGHNAFLVERILVRVNIDVDVMRRHPKQKTAK